MLGGGEDRHIDAELGDEHLGGALVHAADRVETRELLGEGCPPAGSPAVRSVIDASRGPMRGTSRALQGKGDLPAARIRW
jgi:hypothetical protein